MNMSHIFTTCGIPNQLHFQSLGISPFFWVEISKPPATTTTITSFGAARLRVGLGGMNLTTSFPEPKDRDSGALPMGPAELLAHPPFADYVL